MFETSPSIAALAAALAKAQGSIKAAVKGRENTHFKSKYADLAAVWEACREALTQNGLAVVQSPGEIADGRMHMTTMLLHSSGEWMRGDLAIPLGNKLDAQGYGSATSYARRYALAAFVGVASDDDDGNAAAANAPANDKAKPPAPQAPTLAERANRLEGVLKATRSKADAEKAWNLAADLRKELDARDPERLFELSTLYIKTQETEVAA